MPDDDFPSYRRAVLKVSGESLAPPGGSGIDGERLRFLAGEVAAAAEQGTELIVVVGGGNIVRGAALAESGGIEQATADSMGMLATVINGLALREALESLGCEARLMSALEMRSVAETFIRDRALRHLEKGRMLVLAAGTGQPFFTTDTCAALRGIQLKAEVLLKATKVDGVYSDDPKGNPDAERFERLTFDEVLKRKLRVMDLTAMAMCREHALPVVVFDFSQPGAIQRAVSGGRLGTLVML